MRISLLLLLLSVRLVAASAAAGEELLLHVPKLATPPTIDGELAVDEWAGAAAVTGFRGARYVTAYPESLRMIWYVGYDDENLYLAMDANFPPAINLKADVKQVDDNMILYDDHVEIQVSSAGRQGAKTDGMGFYKLIANPRSVLHDTWYYNGTPGTEDLWSSGATVKSTSGDDFWRLEIQWPFQTMRVKHIDYRDLIVHLSRAVSGGGWYFASVAPGTWNDWQGFYRFRLAPEAPAVRFLRKGEIVNGRLDTLVRVRSKSGDKIRVVLKLRNGRDEQLFAETQEADIVGGQAHDFVFTAPELAITEEGNSYRLEVFGSEGLLYNALIPFREFTEEYVQQNMQPWIETRPEPGEYRAAIAYLPSTQAVRTSVDLDIFGGLPEELRGVNRYRANVATAAGEAIAMATFPIAELAGRGTVDVGELPEGDYVCILELLDGAGEVVDTHRAEFVRRHYEWEDNTLGLDPVVLPGFTPLTIDGRTIAQCRHAVTLGPGGLPEQIVADGRELLAEPVRIEATVDGKEQAWQPGDVGIAGIPGRTYPPAWREYMWGKKCPPKSADELPETDGYAAAVTGNGRAGDVTVSIDGNMGYDGWLRLKLTYGTAAPVTLDRLDIVVTLGDWADVMRVGRTFADVLTGRLPAGEGVLWQSSDTAARPRGFRGTWIPCAYLGNGSRGIWYMAERDQGWSLADDQSCVFVERRDGKPVLRLRLVNTPTRLDGERTVDLALVTTPAKLEPENARLRIWSAGCPNGFARSPVLWFNTGWRKYAWAADGFYMPDDGFESLGEWLRSPETWDVQNWATGWVRGQKSLYGDEAWFNEMPIIFYSSHSNFSPALPELATYGGEWLGKNDLVPGKDYGYNRRVVNNKYTNFTGRYVYDTPAKAGEVRGMWTRSLQDCYVWYQSKLFGITGANGTFYDNAGLVWWLNPEAGIGYVRPDGHPQPQCNIYVRHDLTKRLNTLCWLLGRPPMFYPNHGTLDIPFAQKMMAIEGDMYIWTVDGTLFDANSVDGMRAWLVAKGNAACMVNAKKAVHPHGTAGASHRPLRSVFAMALALDIGCDRTSWDRDETRRLYTMLDEAIGLFDEANQAEFIPYWDNGGVAHFVREVDKRFEPVRPDHQFCSLYRQDDRVLVWLVNESDDRVHRDLYLDAEALLGRRVTQLRDLETGETMPSLKRDKNDPMRTRIWPHIYIPPKDFRALILE